MHLLADGGSADEKAAFALHGAFASIHMSLHELLSFPIPSGVNARGKKGAFTLLYAFPFSFHTASCFCGSYSKLHKAGRCPITFVVSTKWLRQTDHHLCHGRINFLA